MELEDYVSKRVKIITTTGNTYIGKVIGFTQALDNEPEIDEIDIRNEKDNVLYGLYENEIKSIEVLE